MDLIRSKKLSKSSTDLNPTDVPASRSEYIKAIKDILFNEYSSPSTESILYFVNRFSSSIKSEQTVDQFHQIVKEAFKQFVDDRVNEQLQLQKPAETEKEINTHNNSIDGYGRIIKHDISIREEDFEKFFVVDIT